MKLWFAPILGIFLCGGVALANVDFDVNKKVDKMKTRLALSDEQADQVKDILEDFKDKAKALKGDKENRINSVLTKDQQGQFNAMKDEWKEKMKKCEEAAEE